jgi:hypothetical protein
MIDLLYVSFLEVLLVFFLMKTFSNLGQFVLVVVLTMICPL